MTTEEVAKLLGVTVRRVQAMIANGQIKAKKEGRDWKISPNAITDKVKNRKPGRPRK